MPYDERDEQTRQFVPTYEDEDYLEAVREEGFAGSKNVAEIVGCSIDNARKRLNELDDRGELEKRDIGGRFVYTIRE